MLFAVGGVLFSGFFVLTGIRFCSIVLVDFVVHYILVCMIGVMSLCAVPRCYGLAFCFVLDWVSFFILDFYFCVFFCFLLCFFFLVCFFFNDTATFDIYTISLNYALPIYSELLL